MALILAFNINELFCYEAIINHLKYFTIRLPTPSPSLEKEGN